MFNFLTLQYSFYFLLRPWNEKTSTVQKELIFTRRGFESRPIRSWWLGSGPVGASRWCSRCGGGSGFEGRSQQLRSGSRPLKRFCLLFKSGKLFFFFYSIRVYWACLASRCTAKHIFKGKSEVLHLYEGPELRMHRWEKREEKKALQPAGFKLTTSVLWGMHSTTVQQMLPMQIIFLIFFQ